MRMPFHDRIKQVYPDAMHTVKNVVEHLFLLIIGKEDSAKVRKTEAQLNRFGLKLESSTNKRKRGEKVSKVGLSYAPFRMTVEEIATANSRVCLVSHPSLDFTLGPIFTRTFGLKSHDWKEVTACQFLGVEQLSSV